MSLKAIDEIADFLCDNIVMRYDDYGIQQCTGAYTRAGKQLKRSDVGFHVLGSHTIGAYQITPDNEVGWIVYDVDDHAGHGTSGVELSLLKKCLCRQDVPFYEELSGSPGSHHVWVFLEEATPADVAFNWARCAVRSRSGYALFRGEIFPKQQALSPDKPYGNLVKLPYGMNRRNGNWSTFVDPVLDGVEKVDLSSWEIQELPDFWQGRVHRESGPAARNYATVNTFMYGAVRPCLKALVESGLRMNHVLRVAVAMEYQAVSRLSEDEIAWKCFGGQVNYDHARTMEELRTIRGFNRPRCETIREGCMDLSEFDVYSICDNCIAAKKAGTLPQTVRA